MTPASTFRSAVISKTFACELAAEGGCRPPLDAHHGVKAQVIRREWSKVNNLSPHRFPDHPLRGTDLDAVQYDPGVGVAICREHHEQLEHDPALFSQLPQDTQSRIRSWAARYGLEGELPGQMELTEREAA